MPCAVDRGEGKLYMEGKKQIPVSPLYEEEKSQLEGTRKQTILSLGICKNLWQLGKGTKGRNTIPRTEA